MIRIVAAALAALPLAAVAQETAPVVAPPDAPIAAPPDAPVALPPPRTIPVTPPAPERSSVYIGVGAGVSDSGQVGGGGRVYRMRLGVARSPRLLLGLEAGQSRNSETSLSYYDVGATFFPWRRWFFVRGGLGLSSSIDGVTSNSGYNALVGLGVAIGGLKGFNVTVNLETVTHTLSSGGRELDRRFWNPSAWLGLEWL